MKRFYLSPMVLVPGSRGQLAWQAKVISTFAGRPLTAVSCITPDDPSAVANPWALCIVETPDQTDGINDAANDALPDLTLDTTLGSLTSQQRNALITKAGNRGIVTTGWNANTTFRTVIQAAGRKWAAAFNENAFDANPF